MQIWRRNLVPNDSQRDWFAAWDAAGLLPDVTFQLIDAAGNPVPLVPFRLRPTTWVDERYMCCFRVPGDAKLGTYTLRIAGVDRGTITLVAHHSRSAPVVADGIPNLLSSGPDTLYVNCVWDRVPVFSSGGFYLNCEWRGLASPGIGTTHAFSTWGNRGPLALVGCTFDGTDRGPVLNITGGDITEPLLYGITCRNISHVNGGNELLCVEKRADAALSARIEKPLIMGWRCYGNAGDIYIAGPMQGALIRDVAIDCGNIVVTSDLANSIIEDVEIRRGRLVIARPAYVTVRRCALLDRRPTRGNRTYTQPFYYDAERNKDEAARWNLPEGVTGHVTTLSLSVKECYFGG